MKLRLFGAAAFSALLALATAGTALAQKKPPEAVENGEEINLAVGEARTVSARDVKNYSEGVAGVVDVKLTSDASQFVLNGRKPGSTTLLLIKNDGSQVTLNINVFSRPPSVVEKEIAQLLTGLSVQPRRVGAQIVIDGTVATEADVRRVEQVASLYPGQVTSLVQVAAPGAPVVASVGAPRRFLIRIDFYFVQYDKDSAYTVGVGFPASVGSTLTGTYSYDFLAGATNSAVATMAGQPLPRLDIAARHGWAKVLKQATVITSNDAEATFSNGGEQNFPINTGLTIGVEKIPFGTNLTVHPHYDPDKRELALKLDADISDLTASISGTPLPGRTTSKLTTNVTLKLGQSIVLSGIRTQSLTHSVSGLPVLSEIPILGLLFGSHSNSELQTEGAIFVVPTVVQSVPSAAAELVDLAVRRFNDYSGNLDKVRAFDRHPGGGVDIPR
ncbi:MAG TPA: pilus assembly protein N-terminal domain-containing protein [Polyangiaceae bacterium]|nr:pilus assembly protein N-terminal domain-containing protein [Polyangiaceae bacterium]